MANIYLPLFARPSEMITLKTARNLKPSRNTFKPFHSLPKEKIFRLIKI